ncbi:MAG: MerR family transcriptional regulator [Gammaproteobacteria bacterium]|nr:MerR family transcriptional regulator [Gammaproteobacteria bacterium]
MSETPQAPVLLEVLVLDEQLELSTAELCRLCHLSPDELMNMVAEGLLDPIGEAPERWRFASHALPRIQLALRLERDLGVNLAGVALISELLDQIERLRVRVERLEFHLR